jgi:hypothetical protein
VPVAVEDVPVAEDEGRALHPLSVPADDGFRR